MTTTIPIKDVYCKHEVNVSVSICVDCRDTKPRGFTGNPELHQVVQGPEAEAASWAPSWTAGAAGELGPWTTAAHEGECANCGCDILPGRQIRHDSEAGGWVCVVCGER